MSKNFIKKVKWNNYSLIHLDFLFILYNIYFEI